VASSGQAIWSQRSEAVPDADALFDRLVSRFTAADPSITPPSEGGRFGASGMKVDGKLFAMVSRGRLVVKLPRQRVDKLVVSGIGERFDPGHGRLMKEWVTIAPQHASLWDELAREALRFVGRRAS
jgi:hypothetical protein